MLTISLVKRRQIVHPATFVLAASMFMTGACGLVAEYILCTVATYILGNSVEQFSVIIAVMMLMMGIGGWLQKFLSDEKLIEKFIFIEVSLALLSGFAPLIIFAAFGLLESHFILVLYSLVTAIGLMIGFEIPVVLRINALYSSGLKANVAAVCSSDYIGAFAGALIWAFVLIRMLPLTEIGFIVGGLNLMVAILTFSYFYWKGYVKGKVITVLLILIASFLMIVGYGNNRAWSAKLEQNLYSDKIVFSTTTKYQHLVLTQRSQLNEYRLYINGNLQFSSLDENIYHEQLVHPVMNLVPDHRNVLILGGGDGMALREVLKYPDVEAVTLVDLDEQMTKIFSTNPELVKLNGNAFADARVKVLGASEAMTPEGFGTVYMETGFDTKDGYDEVRAVASIEVFNMDADKFLSSVPGFWNVIIVDLPDPSSIELVKLYSKEFYTKLRGRLSERGMVAIQSTSPYHSKEAFLCINRTVEAAGFTCLPYHDNVPSFGEWGWVILWKNNFPKELVQDRIANLEFSVETTYLDPGVFRASTVFGKGWLTDDSDDVNTLMEPVLLEKYVHAGWLIE